jgi:hypothetical protein
LFFTSCVESGIIIFGFRELLRYLFYLQLPDTRHVSQPRLDVGQIGNFDRRGEGVPPLPQQPPARQSVTVVGEVFVILRADVDSQNVLGSVAAHYVSLTLTFKYKIIRICIVCNGVYSKSLKEQIK